jgi:hypothetical protein
MAAVDLEHLTRLADQLSREDQQSLIDHLGRQLQDKGSDTPALSGRADERPQSLRGIWQDQFPEEFDLDAALNEIRHEWEKEWPEVFSG